MTVIEWLREMGQSNTSTSEDDFRMQAILGTTKGAVKMREGCELIVNLKVDKKNLAAHMTKHRDMFFDVIVGKLLECSKANNGCGEVPRVWAICEPAVWEPTCPDYKRCNRRYNGLCKMAEGFEVHRSG